MHPTQLAYAEARSDAEVARHLHATCRPDPASEEIAAALADEAAKHAERCRTAARNLRRRMRRKRKREPPPIDAQ